MPRRVKVHHFMAVLIGVLCWPGTASHLSAQKDPQIIPQEDARTTTLRKQVDSEIDALGGRLLEISDWMYGNPEPGFLEFEAARILTEELQKNGFEVTMGVPGLDPEFDKLKVVGGLPADYSGPRGHSHGIQGQIQGEDRAPGHRNHRRV